MGEPRPTDLDWIGMIEGKYALIVLLKPERSGTLLNDFLNILQATALPVYDDSMPVPEGVLPADMYAVLGLDETSSPDNNPYHTAASMLARLWPRQINPCNVANCLEFIGRADKAYRGLLQARDERALLLLVYWFAKVCIHSVWWMEARSVTEGRSICIYLAQYCRDSRVLGLLDYPNSVFDLVRSVKR